MRTFTLLAAAALMSLSAVSAQAATKHHVKHRAPTCADKVMCRKIDALSAKMSTGFTGLTDTVKTGQAADADYQTKQLAYSEQMLTSMKAVETQGGQSYKAILLNFSDRKMLEGEKPTDVANQVCVDSGFKTGKPVDVAVKRGWSHSGTYLNSVVCTF